MLKKINLAVLTWMALTFSLISGAAVASPTPEEGHIPVSGIFVTDAFSEDAAVEDTVGASKVQSAALGGLLVSVFIVIGAGRAYSQLYNRVQSELADVQKQRSTLVRDSVKIHDSEVVNTLLECDALESEISNLQYQLNQIQMEV